MIIKFQNYLYGIHALVLRHVVSVGQSYIRSNNKNIISLLKFSYLDFFFVSRDINHASLWIMIANWRWTISWSGFFISFFYWHFYCYSIIIFKSFSINYRKSESFFLRNFNHLIDFHWVLRHDCLTIFVSSHGYLKSFFLITRFCQFKSNRNTQVNCFWALHF